MSIQRNPERKWELTDEEEKQLEDRMNIIGQNGNEGIHYVERKTECDPTGRNASDPGAKLDSGKPRVSLVLGDFSRALVEVSKVGTFGANKYSDSGWVSVPRGIERYSDAMLRHYLAERQGKRTDPDSGLSHLAHMAWNALAMLELTLRKENGKTEETFYGTSSSNGLRREGSLYRELEPGWVVDSAGYQCPAEAQNFTSESTD